MSLAGRKKRGTDMVVIRAEHAGAGILISRNNEKRSPLLCHLLTCFYAGSKSMWDTSGKGPFPRGPRRPQGKKKVYEGTRTPPGPRIAFFGLTVLPLLLGGVAG